MAAFAVTVFGAVQKSGEAFTGDCLTTNDILGPFYRTNAPIRSDLIFAGLKGSEIQIKGSIFKADCITPLKDALVEIWHCDTEGAYDNDSPKFLHRASWKTDDKGQYLFKTILPGKYLNGKLFRPAHIHFRITHTDTKEIISQIYFAGDPHITEDPWASKKKAEHRILPLIPSDSKGNIQVDFNIYTADK